MRALLSYFSITLRRNNFRKISFIEVWNDRGLCLHIDCPLHVSCFGFWEFAVPYSEAVILKTKNLLYVFCSIYGIYIKFGTFEKKKIVIPNIFPKLQTVEKLVRAISDKHRFRTSFDSQHVKDSQILKKFSWEHFYHIFSSFWVEMISKISTLLKFESVAVFLKTLTVDHKYPVPDCKNFQVHYSNAMIF